MAEALEEKEAAVAKATLAYRVASDLVQEYRLKLRMAEEEASEASHNLDDARHALDEAVVNHYEVPYLNSATDVDRAEFEKRWETRQADIAKVREERQRLNDEARERKEKDLQTQVAEKIVSSDVVRTNLGF